MVDAYGRVTYTNAEGNTYNAILQVSEDTVIEGRQKLLLIVYNEDNTGIEAIYIYVIENGTSLDLRTENRETMLCLKEIGFSPIRILYWTVSAEPRFHRRQGSGKRDL
ncbi:MAG: hypothetical protein ACLRSW_11465 [Christensenellaceae bacterium]